MEEIIHQRSKQRKERQSISFAVEEKHQETSTRCWGFLDSSPQLYSNLDLSILLKHLG
jgi:hypothetical protein